MHIVNIEESCANDGGILKKYTGSIVQTITLTSSCQLLHGLPFNTLRISEKSTV